MQQSALLTSATLKGLNEKPGIGGGNIRTSAAPSPIGTSVALGSRAAAGSSRSATGSSRAATAGGPRPLGEKTVAQNKKATHDYFIEETFHAGIALTGTEIKSIRSGKANLRDSYARVERGEVYLHNLHISPYEAGNRFNHDPLRARKLLLHRSEIRKLIGATKESGYSLVPLRLYLRGGFCKVELALGRGKKSYDKRESIAKRDADREIARAFRERQKG